MNFKKYFICLLLLLFIFLLGCNKEYSGLNIVKLSFQTVDYMGGSTVTKELDFIKNQYKKKNYSPFNDVEEDYKVLKEFSDEQEKIFINGIYNSGLLKINEYYKNENIDDGGGWTLVVEYEDGSIFKSRGSNDSPKRVFDKCSTYFYDLCGEEVMGSLPEFYYNPPGISYSFHYLTSNDSYGSDNSFTKVYKANYKWNKFNESNCDIYQLNSQNNDNLFLKDNKYQVVFYTSNYHCDKKFNKFVLKSYDFNQELTNEKLVYTDNWFDQIELDLELDKIYVYELSYKNGDFIQYTFNTISRDQKVLFGKFRYSIYNVGGCSLFINQDNSFELKQFEYFDSSLNINSDSLIGNYQFEEINEIEYLVLYTSNNQKIVLEYKSMTLTINFELSNFDFESFHLESDNEFLGRVEFMYLR